MQLELEQGRIVRQAAKHREDEVRAVERAKREEETRKTQQVIKTPDLNYITNRNSNRNPDCDPNYDHAARH